MSRVYLGWGAPGNGKSTFALSGLGKTWYAELDPGSYERAKAGADPDKLEVYECYPPTEDLFAELLEEGKLNTSMVGDSQKGAVQVVHRLTGWNERLRDLRQAYVKALKDPEVCTIAFDTAAQLWVLIQNSFKQRIQDETPVERVRLTRLEYEDNNRTMMMFIMAAKQQRKDLVLIAREREKYLNDKGTGELIPSGWGEFQAQADLEIRFSIVNKKPMAEIKKAGGADTALIGMKIPEPTLPKLALLADCATALRSEGVPLPEAAEDILNQGKLLGVGR